MLWHPYVGMCEHGVRAGDVNMDVLCALIRQERVQSGGHVVSLHVICVSGVTVDVLASMCCRTLGELEQLCEAVRIEVRE